MSRFDIFSAMLPDTRDQEMWLFLETLSEDALNVSVDETKEKE